MGILVGMFMGISMGIYCNGPQQNIDTLVVYLPLWKIWLRQLGLLFPTEWKVIKFHGSQTTKSIVFSMFTTGFSMASWIWPFRPPTAGSRPASGQLQTSPGEQKKLVFPLNFWGAVHYEKWRFNQQWWWFHHGKWWFHHGKWWFHHGKWIKLGISPAKWWNPGSCHSEIQGFNGKTHRKTIGKS